jgi:hypothetical protein
MTAIAARTANLDSCDSQRRAVDDVSSCPQAIKLEPPDFQVPQRRMLSSAVGR